MSRSFGKKTENVVATPGVSGDEMMLLRRREMRETFVNVITSCENTAAAASVTCRDEAMGIDGDVFLVQRLRTELEILDDIWSHTEALRQCLGHRTIKHKRDKTKDVHEDWTCRGSQDRHPWCPVRDQQKTTDGGRERAQAWLEEGTMKGWVVGGGWNIGRR
jgi:hypothetical protein